MKYSIIYIVVFISTLSNSFGQSYISDMKKMYELYTSVEEIKLNFSIDMIQEGITVQQQKASIVKKGEAYFYDYYGSQMFINPQAMLLINQSNRSIVIQYFKKKEYESLTKNLLTFNMDSIMEAKASQVKYSGIVSGKKKYSFRSDSSYISQGSIWINQKTGFLDRIIYQLNEQEVGVAYGIDVKINSSRVIDNTARQKTTLSYFVTKDEKGKLRPTQKYLGYELSIIER